jgi:hypothetical protein
MSTSYASTSTITTTPKPIGENNSSENLSAGNTLSAAADMASSCDVSVKTMPPLAGSPVDGSTTSTTNVSAPSSSKKRKSSKKSLSKGIKNSVGENSNTSSIMHLLHQKQHQIQHQNKTKTPMTAPNSSLLHVTPTAAAATIAAPLQILDSSHRSFTESQALLQLRQMGFSDDAASVLRAIRRVCDADGTTTTLTIQSIVDQVSIELISRREELEDVLDDAAQIDAARVLSEADADSEKKRRNQDRREQLENSSIQQVLEHFQKKSILLSSENLREMIINCCTECEDKMKRCVIQLLELERNALFWYQQRCSSSVYKYCGVTSYFRFVLMPKLEREESLDTLKKLLYQETVQLENCLFSLQEQDKAGVPKIFLQASQDAEVHGWCNGEENDYEKTSGDDDEIEIIC